MHVPMRLQLPRPGGDVEADARMLSGVKVWTFPVELDEDTATLRDFHTANTGGPSQVPALREMPWGIQAGHSRHPSQAWHDAMLTSCSPWHPTVYDLCAFPPVAFASWVPSPPPSFCLSKPTTKATPSEHPSLTLAPTVLLTPKTWRQTLPPFRLL